MDTFENAQVETQCPSTFSPLTISSTWAIGETGRKRLPPIITKVFPGVPKVPPRRLAIVRRGRYEHMMAENPKGKAKKIRTHGYQREAGSYGCDSSIGCPKGFALST
jgi:hypothetical protein